MSLKTGVLAFILILITFGSGCATTYTGPHPDYTLRGDAAKVEYYRFKMAEGFFKQRPHIFEVGPDQKAYTRKSFDPILAEVSPRAFEKIKTAEAWRASEVVFLLAALGGAIAASTQDNPTTFVNVLTYTGLGLGITSGIVAASLSSQAACYYNEDLRSKLGLVPDFTDHSRISSPTRLAFTFAF